MWEIFNSSRILGLLSKNLTDDQGELELMTIPARLMFGQRLTRVSASLLIKTKELSPQGMKVLLLRKLAERQGFEPWGQLPGQLLSRQLHSATLPPLQKPLKFISILFGCLLSLFLKKIAHQRAALILENTVGDIDVMIELGILDDVHNRSARACFRIMSGKYNPVDPRED